MPTNEEIGRAVGEIVTAALRSRPDLAASIAVIGEAVAAAARGLSVSPPLPPTIAATSLTPPPPSEPSPLVFSPEPKAAPIHETKPVALVPLKIGDQMKYVKVEGTSADFAAARKSIVPAAPAPDAVPVRREPDLALMADRCRLKEEGCTIAIDRRAAIGTDAEPAQVERIRALIARGKLKESCFIWTVYPGVRQPEDDSLRVIAAAYANLAEAARLGLRAPPGSRWRQGALELLAEAQSALRIALDDSWLTRPDQDQDDAFAYLEQATFAERIYIERYMKRDDGADPARHEDLAARLYAQHALIDGAEARGREVQNHINRAKHHARLITRDPGGDHAENWQKIEAAVAALDGAASHEQALGDVLRPIAHLMPPGEALPSLRAAAARREAPEEPTPAQAEEYSQNVLKVRERVRGMRFVVVGGERREEAVRRVREAFDLADVDWMALPEHSSGAPLEAPIRRADTRAVIVIIKLAGHLHIDDAARYCKDYNKPMVRLPAGYNPEQMAAQILEQIGERL